jgi:hypothetical protein
VSESIFHNPYHSRDSDRTTIAVAQTIVVLESSKTTWQNGPFHQIPHHKTIGASQCILDLRRSTYLICSLTTTSRYDHGRFVYPIEQREIESLGDALIEYAEFM